MLMHNSQGGAGDRSCMRAESPATGCQLPLDLALAAPKTGRDVGLPGFRKGPARDNHFPCSLVIY
jgi:hypothetical protein